MMSAYAHQMEREFSNQSLSSRGSSEIGSHASESGFYMTSFAAFIFLASLVTCGVLLLTLLIALSVMLQSCENRSAGVVGTRESDENYNYCKIFSLHAELNRLDINDIPETCFLTSVKYIKEGQYARDLSFTMRIAENYFKGVRPLGDGWDLVLMDIDDFFLSISNLSDRLQSRFVQFGCEDCLKKTTDLKQMFTLKLYRELQARGWSLILFSRKPEKQKNATIEHLITAGYGDWTSLLLRFDVEMQLDSREYFSRLRNALQKQGFRIQALVSSQIDALTGPFSGNHIFKLPNPIFYYNVENSFVNMNPSQ